MRKPRKAVAAAFAAAAALTLSACGTGSSGDESKPAASFDAPKKGGVVLDTPYEKPDLKLTDQKGDAYDLVKETKGKPTLLFFGYTHCPDVCPLTMSNIAVAKSQLTEEEQKKLEVVFVTSDPERDDPKRLQEWLRGQDPAFTGLTGDFDAIQAGAKSVNISIDPAEKKKNGDIISSHGSQLLAFSPKDDKAHVLYTDSKDANAVDVLKKELPKIIKGENP